MYLKEGSCYFLCIVLSWDRDEDKQNIFSVYLCLQTKHTRNIKINLEGSQYSKIDVRKWGRLVALASSIIASNFGMFVKLQSIKTRT